MKRSQSRKIPFSLIIIISLLLIASVFLLTIFQIPTEQSKKSELQSPAPVPPNSPSESTTIQMQDFPSTEQGTFTGQLKPNYYKEKPDQIIILFVSSRLPGLALIYYPYEKKLVGGTPQMIADNIILFDGVSHKLGYSFQQKGQQLLMYDDKVIAQSEFRLNDRNDLTGMFTQVPEPQSEVFNSKIIS